jgi:hypothetical protein
LRRKYLIIFIALLIAVFAVIAGCGDDNGSLNGNGKDGKVVDGNGGDINGSGMAEILLFTSPG